MPRTRLYTGSQTLNSGSETVLCTLQIPSLPANNLIDFDACVQITPSATGGPVTLQLERGSAAGGTHVNPTITAQCVASVATVIPVLASDLFPLDSEGLFYVITALQTTGTAWTVNNASMQAVW